jgi:hypothetical protein
LKNACRQALRRHSSSSGANVAGAKAHKPAAMGPGVRAGRVRDYILAGPEGCETSDRSAQIGLPGSAVPGNDDDCTLAESEEFTTVLYIIDFSRDLI